MGAIQPKYPDSLSSDPTSPESLQPCKRQVAAPRSQMACGNGCGREGSVFDNSGRSGEERKGWLLALRRPPASQGSPGGPCVRWAFLGTEVSPLKVLFSLT